MTDYTYCHDIGNHAGFGTQEEQMKDYIEGLREDAKDRNYLHRTEYKILGPSKIQVWVLAWPENEKDEIYGKDWLKESIGEWRLRTNCKLGFLTAIDGIKNALKEACCRMRNN